MLFTFITVKFVIDESLKYSKSGESHECTETSENVVADPYYWNSYNGTRTTHFKRDANVSDSGEQSYYEKITADWTNHANEQGNLEYKISADSEITVKAKGDYSSYLYEYSDDEFDGCYHYSYSYEYNCGCGCGCGWNCSSSYSEKSSLHTYSENKRTIDVSEHYESELHENRHTDGGAFERVSFDGFANGGGSSSNPTHQYSEYDYHYDWDDNYCDYHSWGSVDNYNDSTNDTSGSASYDYSADWNWNKDGEKSSSVTNQVSGHRGYTYDSYYDNSYESYCDYGCGYSCSSSDSCNYSCTYFDYNESVQYTGWGRQGGQVGSPFSVRWSPFSGSISDGSDCGYGCGCGYGDGYGCGCGDSGDYSYRSANFHAPNFSVTMTDETYNGENHEYNDVWHPGRGSYYYYYDGYLYSGSAPGSHLPSGSAPGTPSAYGSVTVAGIPLNYNGNPNFTNYAFIDPEAILDEKCPKPDIPVIPSPSVPNMDEVCFAAGTLVLMADSSMKRIEEIEVGDFVLARNDKLPNSPTAPRRINETKHNPPSVTYHLKFRANSGDKEIYIRVTPEHPFYVENRGWIAVENLNVDDICVTANENKFKLLSKILDQELIPVYNLEVDINHTYFVGDDSENCLLVHNQYDPPKLEQASKPFKSEALNVIARIRSHVATGIATKSGKIEKDGSITRRPLTPQEKMDILVFAVAAELARGSAWDHVSNAVETITKPIYGIIDSGITAGDLVKGTPSGQLSMVTKNIMSAAKNLKDEAINVYIPFAVGKYKDVTIQDLRKAFEDSVGGAIQERSRADLENHFIKREINGQNNIRFLTTWEIDVLENRSKYRNQIIQYDAVQEQRRRGR